MCPRPSSSWALSPQGKGSSQKETRIIVSRLPHTCLLVPRSPLFTSHMLGGQVLTHECGCQPKQGLIPDRARIKIFWSCWGRPKLHLGPPGLGTEPCFGCGPCLVNSQPAPLWHLISLCGRKRQDINTEEQTIRLTLVFWFMFYIKTACCVNSILQLARRRGFCIHGPI